MKCNDEIRTWNESTVYKTAFYLDWKPQYELILEWLASEQNGWLQVLAFSDYYDLLCALLTRMFLLRSISYPFSSFLMMKCIIINASNYQRVVDGSWLDPESLYRETL